MRRASSERGAALILAIMCLLFLAAVGVVVILTTSTEMIIAGGYRGGEAVRYAAEAAAERVLADLSPAGDWNTFVDGSARSTFVDGPPGGVRTLSDGSTLDLDAQVNMANCQSSAGCSIAEMNAVSADRPWGLNNPRWRLLAYGPLDALAPDAHLASPCYGVVLVGDDSLENDDDPTRDGTDADNPGSGIIALRALAFGPRGASRAIELTVARPPSDAQTGDYNDRARQNGLRILSWREVQ
jgi:hypothetical protein